MGFKVWFFLKQTAFRQIKKFTCFQNTVVGLTWTTQSHYKRKEYKRRGPKETGPKETQNLVE